jgi:hypothetical protein
LDVFVRREHHARVPTSQLEEGYRLGQWVAVQRTTYAKGKLSEARVRRLEALEGWTWRPRDSREQEYEAGS